MKMPRSRALLLPIFQKVSNSLFITKIRTTPITIKLAFLKNSSRKLKRFQLFNNGFLRDYQLSPLISKTQLQNRGRPRRRIIRRSRRSVGEAYSALFLCRCLGRKRRCERGERSDWVAQSLPAAVEGGGSSGECLEPLDYLDDGSIDERAERFIEWFYEEMRLQRQESI